ncbi:MAG: SDR family oxidoreductase [Rhodospirillaceae bacterium]|jgi:NAD(P)-dependent dehydrogenase (short-subunit alcohol dehydrogenase family)|nr:SDR family oxidoreductase [Rhodospirillaceae bacterium]MBT5564462.1 SDR family oxidoreductase [Rhodospirillaceae bacterium]MBT6089752.1 SDR family oxidoreductase [Rhodospirillaceae bacterium]
MTRIATLLLSLFAFSAAEAATVLITGASRGIGFEFAKRYAEQKWDVIATARSPEDDEALQALASAHSNVRLEVLDVTDHAGIDALATKLKNTPIDVLINNAGVAGGRNTQDFGAVDYSVFNDVMNINVLGPLKVTEAFLDHVAASDQKKIINISSSEGRLSQVRGSRQPFYRASKSALNMVMKNVSIHPTVQEKGVIIGLLTPGFVDTDFTAGLPKQMMIDVETSVSRSMAMIEKYDLEMSGRYFANTGEEMTW